MDEVVAPPGLHDKVPAEVVLRVEFPQPLTTFTTGDVGIFFGAATPVPAVLVQPPTVVVTL